MPVSLSAACGERRDRFTPAQAPSADGRRLTLNDHLRLIHGSSARLHFRRGETIFAEGESAGHVYKVLCGQVRLCRFLADGRRHIGNFALAGDLIGFVDSANHPMTAEAVDDVTLISYPRSMLDRLAESNPSVRSLILAHVSATLLDAQHHLLVLGCRNARERVSSFLVRLAERTDTASGETLDIAMPRQDIADHLGLTCETVCRVLTLLKAQGIISAPGSGQIVLKDLSGLRALADAA
jgi:CRP-like cAMP-binding protein